MLWFVLTVVKVATVYHKLGELLKQKDVSAKNVGDEGGYAPALDTPDEALDYIEKAIEAAGLEVGKDMFLALDCAASEFYDAESKKVIPNIIVFMFHSMKLYKENSCPQKRWLIFTRN